MPNELGSTKTYAGLPVLDLSLPYKTRRGVPVRNLYHTSFIKSGYDGPPIACIAGEVKARYRNSWHYMEWYPNGRFDRNPAHNAHDLVLDAEELSRRERAKAKRFMEEWKAAYPGLLQMAKEASDKATTDMIAFGTAVVYVDWGSNESLTVNAVPGGFTEVERYRKRWSGPWYHATQGDVYKQLSEHLKPEGKMLDLTKKYRTRDGREVTNLHASEYTPGRLYGYVACDKRASGKEKRTWLSDGKHLLGLSGLDLVLACETTLVFSRKYQTAKGEPVEFFAYKDGRMWGRYLHGYKHGVCENNHADGAKGEWRSYSWDVNDHDLQQVKPTETRELWLRHVTMPDGDRRTYTHFTEAGARMARQMTGKTVAITGPHTVTFKEGDGLKD